MKHLKSFESLSFNTPQENHYFGESDNRYKNYMFFQNLKNIKRTVDDLLEMDPEKIDSVLDGHEWADDHVSVAMENIEHVSSFLIDRLDYDQDSEGGSEPEEEYKEEEKGGEDREDDFVLDKESEDE